MVVSCSSRLISRQLEPSTRKTKKGQGTPRSALSLFPIRAVQPCRPVKIFVTLSLASPNSIRVFGLKKSGFSMPA